MPAPTSQLIPLIEEVNVRLGDCDCDYTVTERGGPSGMPCQWCVALGRWRYSRGHVVWMKKKKFQS